MQKQLHQIDWSKGQTDGDVGGGFVRLLLNVELDTPGRLGPRARLDMVYDVPNQGLDAPISFAYIPTDPGDTYASGIIAMLFDNRIEFSPLGLAETIDTIYLDSNVDSTSYLIAREKVFYLVAHSGGDPAGVFLLWGGGGTSMFIPPNVAENHPNAAKVDFEDGWNITAIGSDIPTLIELSDANDMAGYPIQFDGQDGFTVGLAFNELYDEAGLYEGTCVVEYMVQLKRIDGTRSQASNSIVVGASLAGASSLVYTLAVPAWLDRSVASIDIYRKVITIDDVAVDDEMRLMESVILSSDSQLDYESVSPQLFADTRYSYNPPVVGETVALDTTARNTVTNRSARDEGADRGVYSITYGWLKQSDDLYSSGNEAYVYIPKTAATGPGALWQIMSSYTEPNGYSYSVRTYGNGAMLVSSAESGYGEAHVYDQTWTPEATYAVRNSYDAGPVTVGLYNGATYAARWNTGLVNVMSCTAAYSQVYSVNSGWSTAVASDQPDASYFPKVGSIDRGDMGRITTFRSVNGASSEDGQEMSAMIMSIHGGRMFALDVTIDGNRTRSQLNYSEYGSLSMFSRNNYIEFSGVSGGAGTAIAAFKGRLLILHESHASIMDISGGTDVTWRDIGAYPGIGCLSRDTCAETQYGVVFGDASEIYFFDGNRIHTITAIPEVGVHIRDTYSQMMASGSVKFFWNSRREQLFIAAKAAVDGDPDAIVLDLGSMAWHTHVYEETGLTGALLYGSIQYGTNNYMVARSDLGFHILMEDESSPRLDFTWGLETGPMEMKAPEIVKKIKRLYVDLTGDAGTSGELSVYIGDSDEPTNTAVGDGPEMIRSRINMREYSPSLGIYFESDDTVVGGTAWKGFVESVGLSYKPKALK